MKSQTFLIVSLVPSMYIIAIACVILKYHNKKVVFIKNALKDILHLQLQMQLRTLKLQWCGITFEVVLYFFLEFQELVKHSWYFHFFFNPWS